MSNCNFNNYITLINKDNKTKTCKVGFSWTSLFFIYLVPLFRLDFKNFTLQILLYSACIVIVPLSPILVTIVYIGIAIYYNNLYIKDLVNKGYMPYSDKDALLLDKVLNNKVVNLGLNKTSDDKLDTINKNSTSQVYDDLIKRKDDLIKSLENVDYKVEENIKDNEVYSIVWDFMMRLEEQLPRAFMYYGIMDENKFEQPSSEIGIFLPFRHFEHQLEKNIEQANGIGLGCRERILTMIK